MRGITSDPRAIAFVARLQAKGYKRDRIVAASKAGTDGWPIEGESLSNGGMTTIYARLDAASKESLKPPTRPAKRANKRIEALRELEKEAERAGKRTDLIRFQMNLQKATARLEVMDLATFEFDDKNVMSVAMRRIHNDMTDLQIWLDYQFENARVRMDDNAKLAVIRHLEEGKAGRTEAELATMERLRERMERKLLARLAARGNGTH